MSILGQANKWWQQRAELQRQATRILRDDRRATAKAVPENCSDSAVSSVLAAEPLSRNGWMQLSDLKRALRAKGRK
jgi:hypothetical protein